MLPSASNLRLVTSAFARPRIVLHENEQILLADVSFVLPSEPATN